VVNGKTVACNYRKKMGQGKKRQNLERRLKTPTVRQGVEHEKVSSFSEEKKKRKKKKKKKLGGQMRGGGREKTRRLKRKGEQHPPRGEGKNMGGIIKSRRGGDSTRGTPKEVAKNRERQNRKTGW